MKTSLLGIALATVTLGVVLHYSAPGATTAGGDPLPIIDPVANQRPRVDVVFALDTTGSMSGLIQTAKEKIWSIASTMAAAQPTPELRIGLVAYRDRGDAYVTRVVDLSADLDSVYAALMDFQADGGGDGPESVNRALYDAVHEISWSEGDNAYQAVFLVGDAPPHTDYNEAQFPEIVARARERGIVINTIQCGDVPTTTPAWNDIASLGGGTFFQVEQAGSAVAFATPFDTRIAELSARLDQTRLYYGSKAQRERMEEKVAATEKLHAAASVSSRARRGVFNAAAGGRENFLGEQELVSAVASGEVALDELDRDALPEPLQPMAPAEQKAYVAKLAEDRAGLESEIQALADERSAYLAKKVEEAGGAEGSLDRQLFEAVRDQAGRAGLAYGDAPAY